jgi:spore coat polysaccharide biosynthesis protein SpsF
MKIIVITQARTGSTRFPNKIMNRIEGKTLLSIHVNRIKKSKKINSLIVATTNKKDDDIIELEANNLDVHCYRGDENDVLDRFYKAAKPHNPDYVVRLTSDCPLIDSHLMDEIIEATINSNVDYCSNTLIESYPDGQDVEVFTFSSLKKAWEKSYLNSEREHVTPYMKKNFRTLNIHSNNMEFNKVRMTVDEPNDFEVIKKLTDSLGFNDSWLNYTKLYLKDITISSSNNSIKRNEGYIKSIKNDLNK